MSSFTLWFFGIPGSGKTTIANIIFSKLTNPVELLDSDELRERITPNPVWSKEERSCFYNALWEINCRLRKNNISVLISASGGGVDLSIYQKQLKNTFFVYVDSDIEVASPRQSDNLYNSASSQLGISLPILRKYSDGSTNEKDNYFVENNNLSAYELQIPDQIDLKIQNNFDYQLDGNCKIIMEYLKNNGLVSLED